MCSEGALHQIIRKQLHLTKINHLTVTFINDHINLPDSNQEFLRNSYFNKSPDSLKTRRVAPLITDPPPLASLLCQKRKRKEKRRKKEEKRLHLTFDL